MKKCIVVGFLLLTSACGAATPTPIASFFPTSTVPPSPIPATAAPRPTSTPEPSPTPFPRLFTENFNASLAGWAILQAGNDSVPNVKIENSHLTLEMDSPYTWLYAIYGAQDYDNVRINAQFTNRALTPASGGVICRYSEDQGWYEFNISADGTYNVLLGRWLSAGVTDYLPITDGSSKAIQPSGAVQKIGLVCSDTTLSLYINGTLIRNLDVSSYSLSIGKVGVAASSFENSPIVVGFDSVTISEP